MLIRRTIAGLAFVAFLALGALASCGAKTDSDAGTPGFDGKERSLDTTPFTMPGLSDEGDPSSTLPEGFFKGTTSTTTSPPDTTIAPATTTTTEPDLYLPPTSSITNLCGMSRSVASLFPPGPISAEETGPRLDAILPNLLVYVAVAPPEMKEDVIGVRTALVRLAGLFKEGGNRLDYPPLAADVQLLIGNQPPYDQLPAELQSIQDFEDREC